MFCEACENNDNLAASGRTDTINSLANLTYIIVDLNVDCGSLYGYSY
ncbi:hypothetical protein MHIR_DE00689 [Candidatus Doolittlea endobia]|uniref:Uncharacterized protein n=1 Tax=Candidatus Doolittlea endobia TaxID=1778262 RepID=A0A143WTM3_9ENTR|nr:hypothetical protein MHIR_DE00689 [Candidatus Doolittlea endobia]